jgi:hypothetical protein
LGSHHTIGVSRKGPQCPRAVWSVRDTAIEVPSLCEGGGMRALEGLGFSRLQ